MKRTVLMVVLTLFTALTLCAQNIKTKGDVKPIYLLEPERSTLKAGATTSEKYLQLGEMSGKEIVVISEGEKTMPAIYTLQPDASKLVGTKVYFNTMGLYLIEMDESGFVSVYPKPLKMLGQDQWTGFAFSNFYGFNKEAVATITKQDIEEFAIEISKKSLKE